MSFKSKYEPLIEAAIERYQQGGFINGDYVRFVDNIKTSEFYKKQVEHVKAKIDSLIDSDLHLRISAVKSIRPALAQVDGGMNAADDFYVDICMEYAPGLYKDPITVPSILLHLIDTPDAMGRMTPPDSQVYKTNIHGAKEIEKGEEQQSLPKKDTKILGGNKWVDKPGGGGGDGMKPIKETKEKKCDVVALEEAYASIYKG